MTGLSIPQRAIAVRMLSALLLSASVLLLAARHVPPLTMPQAAQALTLLPFPLMLAIAAQARQRFVSTADRDASAATSGSDQARQRQAIIQNTLEQTVLAAVVLLAWLLNAPPAWLGAVPAAIGLFLIGRLLFAIGYRRGATGRAFGFALTFYPTVLLAIVDVFRMIRALAV